MTRAIDTSQRKVKELARQAQSDGRIVAGTLAEDYDGVGKTVNVRIGRTTNSGVSQARITPNTLMRTFYPEGTPVSIRIQRGRAEVLSFGATAQSRVLTILEKTGASQSIATGLSSPSKVTFSTSQVVYDPYSTFDDTNDSIVAPFDGLYRFSAYTRWDSDDGARRQYIYLDGADRWLSTTGSPDNGAGTFVAGIQGISFQFYASLSQDQTLQLYASQNGSASLILNAAGLSIELVD